MSRRGYTLVEALMATFVMGIGLLAITAFIVAGVMETNRTVRTDAVQQCSANAVALGRIIVQTAVSSMTNPSMPNQFLWVYQPNKTPALPGIPYNVPLGWPGLALDIEGPYEKINSYTTPTGQVYNRPFFTGRRMTPVDPERYTWAYAIRPVRAAGSGSVDQGLADVSIVVFKEYDPNDPRSNPYVLNGAQLTAGNPTLVLGPGVSPSQVPTKAILVDGENGYVYELTNFTVQPAARAYSGIGSPRADSKTVIVVPRAIEVVEVGIISWR